MRKIVILFMLSFLVTSVGYARRHRAKAGKVSKNVYVDSKYDFKLTLQDGWRYKIFPNKSNFRLVMTEVNYDIPPVYLSASDYTKIPRLVIYADTTSLSAAAFIDSLVSNTFKSKQKKEILKEFEILSNFTGISGFTAEKLVQRKREVIRVSGARGTLWTGQVKYRNEVSTSASSIGAKRVYGAYGGAIIGIKKGNDIILFHLITEWNYFDNILKEVTKMVNTLQWKVSTDKNNKK